MEKKYESDMTRKEKRAYERQKLSQMNFKQKAEYIWEYYKWVFGLMLLGIAAIVTGVQIYHNAQQIELLSIAVVDASYSNDANVARLEEDLVAYMGTGDPHEMINMDTSPTSNDDYNSTMKMMVVMATGSTDILICGESMYEGYEDQEAILTWEEVLGDQYEKYEEYMTEGRLDLSKCKNWASYTMVPYEPAYAGVVASSKRLENCVKFVEMMTE